MVRFGQRVVFVFVGLAAFCGAGALPRADDPRHLTPADKQAMLAIARRMLASRKAVEFDPESMPAKLRRSRGAPLILSAHRPGHEPLIAVAADGALFDQLRQATQGLKSTGKLHPLPAFRLKVDLVASMQRVVPGGPQPEVGLEGLWLESGERRLVLPPSEALRLGLGSGQAFVAHALERFGGEAVEVRRFTATSFMERQPGGFGPVVELYRAMPLVERVNARRLRAAAVAAGDWLLRCQKPDGTFHYRYDPVRDAFDDGDYSATRHAGVALALAQLCRVSGQERFGRGAYRALEWLAARVKSRGPASWVEFRGEATLGATALTLLALVEYRRVASTGRFDKLIRGLGRTVLRLQRPDGFFWSHLDAGSGKGYLPRGEVPLFAPGEAFLALATLRGRWPEAVGEEPLRRAADFWAQRRDKWYEDRDLGMIVADSWSLAALDELHRLGLGRRPHLDYCFFLAEQILARQETPTTARWLDHVGAPIEHGQAPETGTTAACCEGLVAAWRLAGRIGIPPGRYRQGATLAARFVLAHQFDRVNSYLVRNPGRALGSFFSSYAKQAIRMDEVQHAISALLGVAELLEAEEP